MNIYEKVRLLSRIIEETEALKVEAKFLYCFGYLPFWKYSDIMYRCNWILTASKAELRVLSYSL